MIGQEIRLNRLVSKNKNCVIAALDAGGFFGPYEGLIDIKSTCSLLKESDAILLEPGNIPVCKDVFLQDSPPLIITRLNWNTDYCFQWGFNQSRTVKSLSPKQALSIGADVGIASLSISIQDETVSAENIKIFTEIIADAIDAGLPIIGELYPPKIKYREGEFEDLIFRSARIASELGANAIKTFYTGKNFKDIVTSLSIPVFTLGGDKKDKDLDSLLMAEKAVKDGARGAVFGRNLYQSKTPEKFLLALKEVVNLRLDSKKAALKYGLTI